MFQFAYASGNGTLNTPETSLWSGVVLAGLIFILFWFLILRPQAKRIKQQQALIQSLKKGDSVITHSGIIGKIIKVDELTVRLQIAEGVEINLGKNYISGYFDPSDYKKKIAQNQNTQNKNDKLGK